MQFVLLVYSDPTRWPQLPPDEQKQWVAAYHAYTEALAAAGVLRGSNRLEPSSTAATVRSAEGRARVLDGPYAETKEQLGGYFLIDVPDRDAALAWAARCPGARHGSVEVRAVGAPPTA
ncbi:MAG: hypothetical protein DCC71_14795 [Proteobacteria bacterium]|nr:MAG: hypothetical protein DCC71_14795 [Pseudomonadota bacterium]